MYVCDGRTDGKAKAKNVPKHLSGHAVCSAERTSPPPVWGREGRGRGEFVSALGSDDRARAVADADVGMDDGDRPH